MRFKESKLRYFWSVAGLLEFDKLASTHPQVVYVPAFKNGPEILPEQKTFKGSIFIDDIYPPAVIFVSHKLERLPKRFVFLNLKLFDLHVL